MTAAQVATKAEKTNEIELKLLAPPDVLHDAATHPAIAEIRERSIRKRKMRTVYYDTKNMDLAAMGVALRIRSDGQSHRQMIKTLDADTAGQSGAISTRREWQWDLPDDKPDVKLIHKTGLTELAALISDKGVKPVFRSEIDRTVIDVRPAPSTHIEIAIDDGVIRAGKATAPVSEIELELKSGQPAYLYDLAMDLAEDMPLRVNADSKATIGYRLATGNAPAAHTAQNVALLRTMSVADGFRFIARSCIAHILANESAAAVPEATPESSEGIHQMRIGIRRLLTTLKLFRPAIAGDRIDHFKAELKWLFGELAPSRDWDVAEADISGKGKTAKTAKTTKTIDKLRPVIDAARRDAHAKAIRAIRSRRYARLILGMSAWVEASTWHKCDDIDKRTLAESALTGVAEQWLQERYDKIRAVGGPPEKLDEESRHRLRKALKEMRYATEFFASLYPAKKSRKFREAMKPLVKYLGRLNDMATSRSLLKAESKTADDDTAKAADKLRGKIKSRMRDKLDADKSLWKSFEKAKPFWG